MNAAEMVGGPVTTEARSACDPTDKTAETWGVAGGGNHIHASSHNASTRNEPKRIHRFMPSTLSPRGAMPRLREDTAWHTHHLHHSGHHELALKQRVGLDLFEVLPLGVVETIPQLVSNDRFGQRIITEVGYREIQFALDGVPGILKMEAIAFHTPGEVGLQLGILPSQAVDVIGIATHHLLPHLAQITFQLSAHLLYPLIQGRIVVGIHIPTYDRLQLPRMQRLQGVQFDGPLSVAIFKATPAPFGLFNRSAWQVIVLHLLLSQDHQEYAHIQVQPQRAHKVFDLARHRHRHALPRRVEVGDIEDARWLLRLLQPTHYSCDRAGPAHRS